MSITPFTATGRIDESGLRAHLARMVDLGLGVYLASPGSGEGHSLCREELEFVYRVGVEVCKGKVAVFANPPESRTPEEALAKAQIAIDCGVDLVQLYPLDGGHGMRPTLAEQEAYYRFLLDRIDHPTGISVNALAGGYGAPCDLFKRLCTDYPRITLINVNQPPTAYLAELMDVVPPRVAFYTAAEMLPEALTLGAKGCLTGQANVVPHLIRSIGRYFKEGRFQESGHALRQLFRFNKVVAGFALDQSVQQQWSPRWIKAAMRALDLPGHGEGRMRPPYATASQQEMAKLSSALHEFDVAAVEADARLVP